MNWENVICKKCGSENDYSIKEKSKQRVCRCNVCNNFLGCKPHELEIKNDFSHVVIPFGQYKGEKINGLKDSYLWWVYENVKIKGTLAAAIKQKLLIVE